MAQSPELASGSGFAFEDQVAASYMAALLADAYAPGTVDRRVVRVALQQRDFGEPLDDIIVDAEGADGSSMRLGLQCKQSLTISDAAGNADFRSVILDSWNTRSKANFRRGEDRYGAAVCYVAQDASRGLKTLCELARKSGTIEHFRARFERGGNASAAVARINAQIAGLLKGKLGRDCGEGELWDFLAHFVLLQFDFLVEGSASRALALNQLSTVLAEPLEGEAPGLWAHLCLTAREGGGRSAEFDRPHLVRFLAPSVRLRASEPMRRDVERLTQLAETFLADIENDVGGVHLQRSEIQQELDEALGSARFVQITGLPGVGKSALLRARAETTLALGAAIVLKHDRLTGPGWIGFAAAHGLTAMPLKRLLAGLPVDGTPILFVDGLDRVALEHRGIVLDVMRPILCDPDLSNWRIVVTLRQASVDSVRNWIGSLLDGISIGTVDVGGMSDIDVGILARAKPSLVDLLFGSEAISEIARRPFFAKILSRRGTQAGGVVPQSEVDLAGEWWSRGGGFDLDEAGVIPRQRALLELARSAAMTFGQAVALSRISDGSVARLNQLVADGVLQRLPSGEGFRFAHDIFLEWSLCRLLEDRRDEWLVELRSWGEPPLAGRAVELKSQREFLGGDGWRRTLRVIQASGMRSQWTRAWLLAPVALPRFLELDAAYTEVLFANQMVLLRAVLVWFQAERTTPNPQILAQSTPTDERVSVADLLGWPADVRTWQRLIHFVLRRAGSIPPRMRSLVVTLFDVWQNMFSMRRNATSTALLVRVEEWMGEQNEDVHRTNGRRWSGLQQAAPGSLQASLANLILRSVHAEPAFADRYLRSLLGQANVERHAFEQVASWSPFIALTHPALLVDVTSAYLRRALPLSKLDEERRRTDELIARRREVAAKDAADRTEGENRFLRHGPLTPWPTRFGLHDWRELAIERGSVFAPASPLREPFRSLFLHAPSEALRLVVGLGNHAIEAWRQLHGLDPESTATPLPLRLVFHWGEQEFWGNEREYLWGRGAWAPPALECAFLALEVWALAEMAAGRDPDDLIREIVAGHEGIGVLQVASLIAIEADLLSEVGLSLLSSQRLLDADRERQLHDLTSSNAALIGFRAGGDDEHILALKAAQARPARGRELAGLITLYLFSGTVLGPRLARTIGEFPDQLPFRCEEHRESADAIEELSVRAARYAELADPTAYRTAPTDVPGRMLIVHESPSASTPAAMLSQEQARLHLDLGSIWMWADKSFEEGQVSSSFGMDVARAAAVARRIDYPALFDERIEQEDLGQRQGAVAAAAAMCLRFPEGIGHADLEWARETTLRAAVANWNFEDYPTLNAIMSWHHAIFAARGLSHLIEVEADRETLAPRLFALISHPLEDVSMAALGEAFRIWGVDPRLGWCALKGMLARCDVDAGQFGQGGWKARAARQASQAVVEMTDAYLSDEQWPVIAGPALPWVEALDVSTQTRSPMARPSVGSGKAAARGWTKGGRDWDWSLAAKVLLRLPPHLLLQGPRDQFLSLTENMLRWQLDTLRPPWAKAIDEDDQDQGTKTYEFTAALGRLLGRILGWLEPKILRTRLIEPIISLPDAICWDLLEPLVNTFVLVHVMDAQAVPSWAEELLDGCASRLLEDPAFAVGDHRDGALHGFHLPGLVDALLLVNANGATGASRFANGDWSGIQPFMPHIDRIVRTAGWSVGVMPRFLTLCERARMHFPAEAFAERALEALACVTASNVDWHSTTIPARLANLIQHFSDRETPMPSALAQRLLCILDGLVDLGDRRAAALQSSEAFRQVYVDQQ